MVQPRLSALNAGRLDPSTLGHRPIRVLLVDDQLLIGEAVRRMLVSEEDIHYSHCKEAGKAFALAEELEPTIILQDLVMPDIDGLEQVRKFKSHPRLRDIPLVVLSAKEEPRAKADAFACGANDYLVKLPDRIELIARIRYHSTSYITLLQRNEAFSALQASQARLAEELRQASEYVVSMLPAPISDSRLRTSWRFFPSTMLGGDAFSYQWLDDETFAIYLLDVCGHGVGSALLSVTALNVLNSRSLADVDFKKPGQVLRRLNEVFQMDRQNGLYFTIWYGVYRPETREMVCAAAGHPAAILLDERGAREITSENPIIGMFPGGEFEERAFSIPPSSKFYLFSDGTYEVRRPTGEMWDIEGLKKYLTLSMEEGQAEIEALYGMLRRWRSDDPLEDDFSMVRVDFG